VQDEDQAKKEDDAHAECSRGIASVSIGDFESACFFHIRLRGKLGAAHYARRWSRYEDYDLRAGWARGSMGCPRAAWVTQLSSQTAMRLPLDV
jgi:hypothetical protein